MSHTPIQIIKLHEKHLKLMVGCTSLQAADLHAKYLRDLPSVQWEVDFHDINGPEDGFMLIGSVSVSGPWGFGSDDMFLIAELDKSVSRDRLLTLKRGQRVSVVGIPHYIDQGHGELKSFTIKSARLI